VADMPANTVPNIPGGRIFGEAVDMANSSVIRSGGFGILTLTQGKCLETPPKRGAGIRLENRRGLC